jgi:hypothetical protein
MLDFFFFFFRILPTFNILNILAGVHKVKYWIGKGYKQEKKKPD